MHVRQGKKKDRNDAPVRERRALIRIPQLRIRILLVDPPLRLGLIVDGIEADDALQEYMQLRVRRRVLRNFEKRQEYI